MQTTKRAFGYVRVSSLKQGEGVSLEAQRDAIEAYAARNHLVIVRWFEEKITAAKTGRPAFNAMVKLLLKGAAHGVILHKVDRGARNLRDWASIADLSDAGVDVHFATESLDFRSRGGRLTADIQAVIAADYIRNLREETLKGIRGRLKQGLLPWGAPLGYLNHGGGKAKTIDPVMGPQVKRIFELYATGQYSMRTLVTELRRSGVRTPAGRYLTKHPIEHLLANPFYCGVIKVRTTGEAYPGIHEPLISPSLFAAVQDLKAGRTGKKLTKHDDLYRGLFRCAACEYLLTPEHQRGHVYYRCHTSKCVTTGLREEVLTTAVEQLLSMFTFTSADLETIERELQEFLHTDVFAQERQRNAVKIKQAKERLSRLTDAFVDQHIDEATFHEKQEHLLLDLKRLEEEQGTHRDGRTIVTDTMEFFERTKSLAQLYSLANAAEKREIVSLASSNRWVDGKDIVLEPSDWLVPVKNRKTVTAGDPTGIRTPIYAVRGRCPSH